MPSFVAVPPSDATPGFLGVEFAPFKTTTVPAAGKPFAMRGLALADGKWRVPDDVLGAPVGFLVADLGTAIADDQLALLDFPDGKQAEARLRLSDTKRSSWHEIP